MLNILLVAALPLLTAPADTASERSNVLWTPQSYATMGFLYERITDVPDGVEFAACLRAQREGMSWVVTEVVVPAQSGNTATGIEYADCTGYEGAAHSHGIAGEVRYCYPSMADRATFAASRNEFLVIWCDREAFTFRTKDLGIGGKDDTSRDRTVTSSSEPHLRRGPAEAPAP